MTLQKWIVASQKNVILKFMFVGLGFYSGWEFGELLAYLVEDRNPLNAELNPTWYLLALLGVHSILHISRIRVNGLYTPILLGS